MAHFLLRAGDFFLNRHPSPIVVDIPPEPIAPDAVYGRPGGVVEPARGHSAARPARGLAFYSLTSAPKARGPGGRLAYFGLIPESGESSARAERPWTDLP